MIDNGHKKAAHQAIAFVGAKIVEVVDLNAEMIRICSTNENITSINQDSLQSDKLVVHNVDAYEYLENTEQQYDLIIVDLPDPNSESLNKLYSNVFYRMCGNRLMDNGVMVFFVKPYHLQVPAFGNWGFNLASRNELKEDITFEVETRYLSPENVSVLFCFGTFKHPLYTAPHGRRSRTHGKGNG